MSGAHIFWKNFLIFLFSFFKKRGPERASEGAPDGGPEGAPEGGPEEGPKGGPKGGPEGVQMWSKRGSSRGSTLGGPRFVPTPKISYLPSKLCFSAKYSVFGQSVSRGHYQPTYQPPEGVYLLFTK